MGLVTQLMTYTLLGCKLHTPELSGFLPIAAIGCGLFSHLFVLIPGKPKLPWCAVTCRRAAREPPSRYAAR